MLGLGLGNLLGSKYQAYLNTTRFLTGLRGYALLELVVSMGGLLVPAMMSYGASAILSVPMTNGAYFVLSFLIILIVLVPFCARGSHLSDGLVFLWKFFGNPKHWGSANLRMTRRSHMARSFSFSKVAGFLKNDILAVVANWLIALLVGMLFAIKPSDSIPHSEYRIFLYQERWVLAELFVLGMCCWLWKSFGPSMFSLQARLSIPSQ
jgi:hypothetical protein